METYLTRPPFDVLTPNERQFLAKHSKITYLDSNETLPEDWQSDFFIIIKGKLKQFFDDELIAGLSNNDWFDTTQKNGEHHRFVTSEQSLLYRIDGKALQEISGQNPDLQNLLFADLSARLAQHHVRHAFYENQQLLHQSIHSLGSHIKSPNFIDSNASIQDATIAMNRVHAKHILINDNAQNRIGMFTQTDVCRAVGDGADLQLPVITYTNFNVTSIHQNQELSEALLLMLDKKIHRLPIVNDTGEIIGVLGQTELLNFLANHSQLIIAKIQEAQNLDELKQAVNAIGKYIRNSEQQGVKTHIIARTVQSLNAQVFSKVWQIIAPPHVFDNTCVFVMGSEGRGEQIMRTDQDNALIIKDGFFDDKLPDYTKAFNDTLADFGYPYCDGNIMMTNPMWCKPLSEFKQQINDWFGKLGESMIWLATLIDAHYICGDKSLFDELYSHIHTAYQTHALPNYINRFAKSALAFADGSHFWQKFTGSQAHDVDLKKAGIFPIVHGVRTLALEHNITATATRTRIDELVKIGVLPANTAQNLKEALNFFLSKRLSASLAISDKSARKVNPNQLSNLDRDLLKESLAVVKDFKNYLTRHYRLDVFGV